MKTINLNGKINTTFLTVIATVAFSVFFVPTNFVRAEFFFIEPSYDYGYASPSYNYDFASPSYNFDYASPSYNYDYSSPSYDYYYNSPSYDYGYSSPSYNYSYASPSYDYSYSYPSYNYSYDYPSYDYSYSTPSYNYSYDYPSYDYSYVSPSYDYSYNTPSYNYSYTSPSYDYAYEYPSYDYSYDSASYDYSYANPSYDYAYEYPSYDYSYVSPSYDYSYASPSYDYSYANPSYDYAYDYPSYDYAYSSADYDYTTPTYSYDNNGGYQYPSYAYDYPSYSYPNYDYGYNYGGGNSGCTSDCGGVDNGCTHNCNPRTDDLSVICVGIPSRVEVGEEVTWTATAEGGDSPYDYDWGGDNGLSGNSRVVRKSYSSSGVKNAFVTVTDDDGRSRTAECSVRVEDREINNNFDLICIADQSTIDEGERVKFTAVVSGGDSPFEYDWSGPNGISGDERMETFRFNREGRFDVRVRVTDDSGRSLSAECPVVRVRGDDNDDFDVICRASDTRVREGESVTFTAEVDGGESPYDYDWSGDVRGDERRETVRFNRAGRYTAKVTVTDDDGNRASDTCPVVVVDDEDTDTRVLSAVTTPTQPQGQVESVFLNQVPSTGADDVAKTIAYAVSLIFWSFAVVYGISNHKNKKLHSKRIEDFKRNNLALKNLS